LVKENGLTGLAGQTGRYGLNRRRPVCPASPVNPYRRYLPAEISSTFTLAPDGAKRKRSFPLGALTGLIS